MQHFLKQVVDTTFQYHQEFKNLVFIVPSIRASSYLRKYISEQLEQPILGPRILSIEEFITELSQLKPLSKPQLLFKLFEVYQKSDLKEKDDFQDFNKWAYTLLSDFDEIDRYLIEPKKIFDYLTAVKKLKEWGVDKNPTALISDYLKFTANLFNLYLELQTDLSLKNESYQGMRYKCALDHLESYIERPQKVKHIFVGFNALNTAESRLIQIFLKNGTAEIYWDLDEYFLNDPLHEAGYYLRQHLKNWPFLQKNRPQGLSQYFLTSKTIEITGIPKNTSQAKYISTLLHQIYSQQKAEKPIALVLADESLLPAVINSIPQNVPSYNITMGLPLTQTLSASFFELLYAFYTTKTETGWYYANVLKLLTHSFTIKLLDQDHRGSAQKLVTEIREKNLAIIESDDILNILPFANEIVPLLFAKEPIDTKDFILTSKRFIINIKNELNKENSGIEMEALNTYYQLFETLSQYLGEHQFLKELSSIKYLLKELVALETLNFKGDPFKGLQIMGMLESRVLDFETVIITSVNEGILPAGKSHNSFIPYDVKKEFGMPTFKDKDAVYTYHFYRLLQRAKNIFITYNTEVDALEGGEKSRFISQLLTDENMAQFIKHKIATPQIPISVKQQKQIEKTPSLLKDLKDKAQKGFSPTSLSNYIKNPYDFYKKNILNIEESQRVEETMAYNTFGTIIHDTLEVLYAPLVGKIVTPKMFEALRDSVDIIVRNQFAKSYSNTDITKGQNLIVFRVIIKYIQNLLDFEIQQAANHTLKIIGLEQKLQMQLNIE
ncbi:MAG: PD-(D/E)XK nuclease family protein, partial [Croceitalea sp.]|nr:PD-(D/E)XK nuclease family protein [Croceitalea sp.]